MRHCYISQSVKPRDRFALRLVDDSDQKYELLEFQITIITTTKKIRLPIDRLLPAKRRAEAKIPEKQPHQKTHG